MERWTDSRRRQGGYFSGKGAAWFELFQLIPANRVTSLMENVKYGDFVNE